MVAECQAVTEAAVSENGHSCATDPLAGARGPASWHATRLPWAASVAGAPGALGGLHRGRSGGLHRGRSGPAVRLGSGPAFIAGAAL